MITMSNYIFAFNRESCSNAVELSILVHDSDKYEICM